MKPDPATCGSVAPPLNASVSSNQAVGQAMAKWQLPFAVFDGFGGIVPGANEQTYDFTDVAWRDLPKRGCAWMGRW